MTNLVKELQEALRKAGFESKVTYHEDDDYFPTVNVGEWEIGVDGSCLNVGLGPYSVSHPEEDESGEPSFRMSPMLMRPDDVVQYLRKEKGLCS